MSILKKMGKVLGSTIFVFAIMAVITVAALAKFTEYDTLKPIVLDVIYGQAQQQISDIGPTDIQDEELYQFIASMCQGQDTIMIPLEELGMSGGLDMITIDCDEFREVPAQGLTTMEYIVGRVGENYFDQFYHKDYDCDFLECVQQGQPYVVMSAKGHEFFESIKNWPWIGISLGIALVYLCSENWPEFMKGLGWPMIFLGITYIVMNAVKDIIVGNMPIASEAQQAGIDIMGPVDAVLKPIMNNLFIVLIAGIALTAGGYLLAYLQKKYGKGAPATKPTEKPATEPAAKPGAKPVAKPSTEAPKKPAAEPKAKEKTKTIIDWSGRIPESKKSRYEG